MDIAIHSAPLERESQSQCLLGGTTDPAKSLTRGCGVPSHLCIISAAYNPQLIVPYTGKGGVV